MADQLAAERERQRLAMSEPTRLALWEMQMEATATQDRERLDRLRALAGGFKYGRA